MRRFWPTPKEGDCGDVGAFNAPEATRFTPCYHLLVRATRAYWPHSGGKAEALVKIGECDDEFLDDGIGSDRVISQLPERSDDLNDVFYARD